MNVKQKRIAVSSYSAHYSHKCEIPPLIWGVDNPRIFFWTELPKQMIDKFPMCKKWK